MTTAMFQVTAECAYVTVDTPMGRSKTLLYKGATFSASAPEREHLEAGGMCAPFGDVAEGIGVNAEGDLGPATSDSTAIGSIVSSVTVAPDVDSDEAAKRTEAQAKLDEIGGTPDGRSSEAVWVEFAVREGLDFAEARKAGKEELRKVLAK